MSIPFSRPLIPPTKISQTCLQRLEALIELPVYRIRVMYPITVLLPELLRPHIDAFLMLYRIYLPFRQLALKTFMKTNELNSVSILL